MSFKTKIITFFALTEVIAILWSIIPFIIILTQQRSDPTNPQYLIDLANLLPSFLWGQIPGIIISAFVHAFFELRR